MPAAVAPSSRKHQVPFWYGPLHSVLEVLVSEAGPADPLLLVAVEGGPKQVAQRFVPDLRRRTA